MRGEEVVVLTAGTTTDPYSEESVEDWSTATTRTVTTLTPPEPMGAAEPVQDARNSVQQGWTLYFPPADPITRLDRVVVRGVTYPVQAEPADWGSGIVVMVHRTDG